MWRFETESRFAGFEKTENPSRKILPRTIVGFVRLTSQPHIHLPASRDYPQARGEGEPDLPVGLPPDHLRIDRVQLGVENPVDCQPAVRAPPRQAGEPRPPLEGPLGHPDQEHDLVPSPAPPGLNPPPTSKSSLDGGASSDLSRSRVEESRRMVIGWPLPGEPVRQPRRPSRASPGRWPRSQPAGDCGPESRRLGPP